MLAFLFRLDIIKVTFLQESYIFYTYWIEISGFFAVERK